MLQGDFKLFEEPGSAFFPMSVDHVRRMKATRLAMPFEAGDLIPGVASRHAGRREDASMERPMQTVFIKPPVGQGSPLPPRRQVGFTGRLKSLIGGKR